MNYRNKYIYIYLDNPYIVYILNRGILYWYNLK